MSARPVRWIAVCAVGFALVTLLVSVAFFLWWGFREHWVFGREPFDPVRWMAPVAGQDETCRRGTMVLDVRDHRLTPGITREQATMLLGRPDWEERNAMEYELGVCLWVVHGLRLYFDSGGRLAHAAIVQH